MGFLLRLLCASALVAALAGPASATAAPGPAKAGRGAGKTVALALRVAKRYWGDSACQGKVAVAPRQALIAGLGPDSDAWATFGSALGANNLAAPAAGYTACTIALTRARWPTRASMTEDWDMLCMTITHEYGHLLGHGHETEAGSVMLPVFSDYSSEPSLCSTVRPRSAPAR